MIEPLFTSDLSEASWLHRFAHITTESNPSHFTPHGCTKSVFQELDWMAWFNQSPPARIPGPSVNHKIQPHWKLGVLKGQPEFRHTWGRYELLDTWCAAHWLGKHELAVAHIVLDLSYTFRPMGWKWAKLSSVVFSCLSLAQSLPLTHLVPEHPFWKPQASVLTNIALGIGKLFSQSKCWYILDLEGFLRVFIKKMS